MDNGTLLAPDRPMTYVDAVLVSRAFGHGGLQRHIVGRYASNHDRPFRPNPNPNPNPDPDPNPTYNA